MPVALQRKKRKRMYPHHSACPPSLPSLIIETISLGLKSGLFHLFLFPPTVCHYWGLGNGKEKGGDVCLRTPSCVSSSLRHSWCVSLFYFLFFNEAVRVFLFLLTIGDLVTANSRVCQLSSVQWPRQRWVFEDTAHIFNRSQSNDFLTTSLFTLFSSLDVVDWGDSEHGWIWQSAVTAG